MYEQLKTPRALAFVTALALSVVGACSRPMDADAKTLARERAAAFMAQDQYKQARAALEPLLAEKQVPLEDWVRAAVLEYADGNYDAFETRLTAARALAPDAPQVLYLEGQFLKEQGQFAAARANFERVLKAVPQDLPNRLALGEVCDELGDIATAEAQYRAVVGVGIENGQLWYCSAVYRLARLLTIDGREDLAKPLNERWSELETLGVKLPQPLGMMLGTLARPAPPVPGGTRPQALQGPVRFERRSTPLPDFAQAKELRAIDVDGDNWIDMYAATPSGFVAAYGLNNGTFEGSVVVKWTGQGTVERVCTFDVDNDGDLDALVQAGTMLQLYVQDDVRGWSLSPLEFPALPEGLRSIVAVDYDHEGDLDLLLCGAFGARVWRNDGAAEASKGGKYSDASAESGLPQQGAYEWCITEDFDGDNDVDILLGGAQGVWLADSLRAGRFQRVEAAYGGWSGASTAPLVADYDGDAQPDLLLSNDAQGFVPRQGARRATKLTVGLAAQTHDWDASGAVDVLWRGDDGRLTGILDVGTAIERAWTLPPDMVLGGSWSAADLDGDGGTDLATLENGTLVWWKNNGPRGKAVRLSYRGARDNRRAVGAVLEYRAQGIYRRIYWRGEPQLATLGMAERLDVLRFTWPNGVVSTQLDLPLEPRSGVDDFDAALNSLVQPSGQIGSCPFLYTWNGERHEFISDVLGITPLGLPIAPGMYVPPDHDEYVLVKGEQLRPDSKGELVLQFTEELREVTYLDHAKLIAVDHPVGSEIFPNELFCFPPFPKPHTHTITKSVHPKALGSDGKDWSASLAQQDWKHAEPFVLHPPQFAGLTQPWWLELSFDKEAVKDAQLLRLVMTGWFFWSDASANMASARHPGIQFLPPMLLVPDGNGGWKETGPPVGFPAGKTKTMIVDISSILNREDPRVRVLSTLRLYWDEIRLACDNDDAALETHELPVGTAHLWRRGFSMPLRRELEAGQADPDNAPEMFEFERLAPRPRWNQHPGLYTRYGACQELLTSVDDRYAILGAGDALTLRFDGKALPPVKEGWRRDWLVYLDGWAKDRDPNTTLAETVEPLPFHGMSGYPYRNDEQFPDTEVHRRWKAEWNTRPAYRWVRPVDPQGEAAWLLEVSAR